nr:MAG TPA: hypothetical protein [Bacteriophage sp.]
MLYSRDAPPFRSNSVLLIIILMYYKKGLISIYKTIFYFERMLVQVRTLLLTQRHYTHLVLSYKHRLYLNLSF